MSARDSSSKRCFKCGSEKPLSEFYRHSQMADGRLNKCKDCTRSDVKEHRNNNLERIRAYDRRRGSDPKRARARKEYEQTPQGRLAQRRSNVRWILRNQDKRAAHNTLNNAIRDGLTEKPSTCEFCGIASPRIHGHHHDYSKPLDVEWLCPSCHSMRHKQERESQRKQGAA